ACVVGWDSDPYDAGGGGAPEMCVGLDSVEPLVLELVRGELVEQPDAPPLVAADVEDHSPALFGHASQGCVELRSAVAPLAPEHVPGEALGVDPGEHALSVAHLAHHQGDVLPLVDERLVPDGTELPVPGREPGVDDPLYETLGPPSVGDQVGRSEEHTSELQSR